MGHADTLPVGFRTGDALVMGDGALVMGDG